jgi:hypothetical protein
MTIFDIVSKSERIRIMKNRIVVTVLHDMAGSLYEQGWRNGLFRPIAHMSLGYGSDGCKDTEVDFAESITFLVEAVNDEKSRVLVLGTCPRTITSSWIKAAELVIKGSDVKTVVIPIAKLLNRDMSNPMIDGSIIFVDKLGIFRIEKPGHMLANDFVEVFSQSARLFNQQVSG